MTVRQVMPARGDVPARRDRWVRVGHPVRLGRSGVLAVTVDEDRTAWTDETDHRALSSLADRLDRAHHWVTALR